MALGIFWLTLSAAADQPSSPGIRNDATLRFVAPDGSALATLAVEIARTPSAIRRGLMHRELRDDSQGMLFIYPDAAPRAFWMRNTPSSLDMIFVGPDHRVLNIAAHTVPYSDTTYPSAGPARFVVEVRAGFAARYGVVPGTVVGWSERASLDKIGFDLGRLDEHGLIGPPGGKRLLHYELCLPADQARIDRALALDPSLELHDGSRGRIGCGDRQVLAVGHTGLPAPEARLRALATLPYVGHIEQTFFE
jgi:uncharacterized membrane protein (UPF0127 family)